MSLFDRGSDRLAFEVDGLHYTVTVSDLMKKYEVTRSWVTMNALKLGGIRKIWPGREEWGTAVWRFPEETVEETIYMLTKES